MTPDPHDPALTPSGGLRPPRWRRLHESLTPDHNRAAAVFWWLAIALGAGVMVVAVREVQALPVADLAVVLAGVAMAMLAGLFPIRIPRWKNSFGAGEIFVFLLLLLHGPAAAVLAAAAEGLPGAWRTSRRWTGRLATPAMASVAMYGLGSALVAGLGALQAHGLGNPGLMLLATMACALACFACNTLMISAVFHLERGTWPDLRDMAGHFGRVGIGHASSAAVACLLFLSAQQSGLGLLLSAAPVIVLTLLTLHYYFRQAEAHEAAGQERLLAAEREAELAAAHVRELQASEQRFQSAFSHASIGMALVGFDGRVLQANPALRTLLGVDGADAIEGRDVADFVDPRDARALAGRMARLHAGGEAFFVEFRLLQPDGAERWAAVHGSLFAGVDATAPCLILQLQDVTARRLAEAGLKHLAFHDSLTGLPNRLRFQQLLAGALEASRGDGGTPFGLLFLDFDRFKSINDSLGHAAGDEFLVAVARRIQHVLRPADVVARLGGDEFAIIASDLDGERYAVTLAGRLLEALQQPLRIAGTEIGTSVSIGITFSDGGYTQTSDMLRDADTAMVEAKSAGRARYALFDAALHTEVADRMRMEGELRHALDAGELTLDYQPLFELMSGRITGFEALARWQHPQRGAIGPEKLLPVAEDAGLMAPLTDFVLRSACRQMRDWQRQGAPFAALTLHVNLSGVDLGHPQLVDRVKGALAEACLRPEHLVLELVENTLMQRLEGVLPALAALREAGVGLCVDDFGTGRSSLRHLSSLPISGLKIAPGFVSDLERGDGENVIVHALVMMADSLGKAVIAEGIESAEQLERLQMAGCKYGQGHFLSRPLQPAQVHRLLDRLMDQPLSLSVAHRDTAQAMFR